MIMKIVYALVVVAVLSGLYLTFMTPAPTTNQSVENTGANQITEDVVDERTMSSTNSDQSNVETGTTADPGAPEPVPGGNDFGMEYPMPTDVDPIAATGQVTTVDLEAFNFGYSENVIRVSAGDTVTINLKSAEGYHDVVIDAFAVASEQVETGEVTSVTFVADRVGTFEYYCSVGNHRAEGMVGTLVVEE